MADNIKLIKEFMEMRKKNEKSVDEKPINPDELAAAYTSINSVTTGILDKIKESFSEGHNHLKDVIDEIDSVDHFADTVMDRLGITERRSMNDLNKAAENLARALGPDGTFEISEPKEKLEDEHFLISFPIDGITTTLEAGDTFIDFYEGEVREGSKLIQYLSKKLSGTSRDAIYSLYVNTDKEIKLKINTNDVINTTGKFYVSGTPITTIRITTTEDTTVTIIGSTNVDTDVKESANIQDVNVVNPASLEVTEPTIYKVDLVAGIENSLLLPNETKRFEIKCRDLETIKYSFKSGAVTGFVYRSLLGNETKSESNVNLSNKYIYFICDDNVTVEVEVWV